MGPTGLNGKGGVGRRRRLISICLTATAAAAGSLLAPPRHAAFAQAQAPAQSQTQPVPDGKAPATGAAPTTAPAAPRGPDVAGDVRHLADTLRNPAARPAERDEAASRLAIRPGAQADAVLREVLGSGSAASRISVARALADDASPREEFIGPLAQLLGGGEQRSAALAEAASTALAAYRRNPAAVDALIRSANDTNQPAPLRIAAIRALGRVVDSVAAQSLVQIVNAGNDRRDVRDAAAEALVEMTGLAENGREPRRWQQWLQQSGPGNNPDAWRADLLETRAGRLERLRRRHESLVADLRQRLSRQYQAAEKDRRQAVLLDFLNSPEPEIRIIGTDLVTLAMQENEDISAPVRDRLVAMVGDSDPQVRLRTADTLHNMNYAGALSALLTQLAQERDDRVKVALAVAIAPIEDPASVPGLLDLLKNNPSPAVALAAVRALGAAARDLRAADPALANTVAGHFRAIVLPRRNTAGNEDLRVAALDGLAALKDPRVLDMARGLLAPDQSPAIRQATLRVVGELGNERGSDLVLNVLQTDRDPVIRRLALDALGKTGGMVYYETLYRYTQPAEADPTVREAAWQALLAALPRGSAEDLSKTAQLLKADPEHRVFVYEALAKRLRQQGKMDDWAQQLQNLADEEMKLKTPRRAEAAGHYEEALNYWLQNNGAPLTIDELTRKVVETRLAAGQYAQAVKFAESAIARQKEAAQAVVGPVIKNEANRLRDLGTPEGYAKARTLIDAALKMNPGLEPRHRKDLSDFLKDIDAATGGSPGTTSPTGSPATNPVGGTPGGGNGNTPGTAQ